MLTPPAMTPALRTRPRAWCLMAALTLVLALPAGARAQDLYVQTQNNTVSVYNAGTGVPVYPVFIGGLDFPYGLTVSGSNLYVLNTGDGVVGQYNAVSGLAVNGAFATGFVSPSALALTGSFLYVSSSTANTVSEYSATTGAPVSSSFITGLSDPTALAVSGSYLYIANYGAGTVGKYNAVTGIPVGTAFIAGLDGPVALAVSRGLLYVASQTSGVVGEYSATTGAAINPSLIGNLQSPSALAIRGNALYVASNTMGTVGEYIATTGAVLNSTLVTGATNVLAIAVVPLAPVIPGAARVTGTAGIAFNHQIAASNAPYLYGATKLPTGLALDSSTGLISGKPKTTGTFESTISAINLGGTATAHLSIVIKPLPLPVFTSRLDVTGTADFPFSYKIKAINLVTGYEAMDLPDGLNLNASTGLISGTPSETGSFAPVISAINVTGTVSTFLSLVLKTPPAPVITSARKVTGINGVPFHYQIAARNHPTTYGAGGLPPGLTFDASSGLISGTPTMDGTFGPSISAINLGGTDSTTLAVTVKFDFAAVRGSYRGLGTVGGAGEGLFTLSLGANGAFTGSFVLAGARYPLNGTFSIDGTFEKTLEVGGTSVEVNLSINPSPAGISGVITEGADSYAISSSLVGKFTAKTLPADLAGRYTAIFPALSGTNPALPHAPGYATMTVSSAGAIHLSGKLGDGTGFAASSHLDADGETWTLFAPLYAKTDRGSIAGTMTFNANADSDTSGTLAWIKPATTGSFYPGAFSTDVVLMAAKYAAPPLATGTAAFSLGGGNLADSAITDSLSISSNSKVTVTGVNDGTVTVTLAPATGAFSGTFLYPVTNVKTAFGGVIYQLPAPSPAGLGQFPGTDQTGTVNINP